MKTRVEIVYTPDTSTEYKQSLFEAGVPAGAIEFMMALGLHRSMTRKEMEGKLGKDVVAAHVRANGMVSVLHRETRRRRSVIRTPNNTTWRHDDE